jgi:hypothetical protein
MEKLNIQLRAVCYREEDVWFSHCLEMDIIGQGDTPKQALDSMAEQINMQIEFSLKNGNLDNLFQPADAAFLRMFAAGKNISVFGEISITKVDRFKVDGVDAREYHGHGMALC